MVMVMVNEPLLNGNEKKYIDTAKKYGLEDPRTYRDKSKLKKATNSFERITGIKWPFK